MMPIDVRYSMGNDNDFLLKWMLDEENNYWFPMSSEEEIRQVVYNWTTYFQWHTSLTALIDGQPCGIITLFLMPYKKTAHHGSFYLVVGREHKKKGVGTLLVRNLLNLAKNYFRLEHVHIELFENSPLIPILQKNGFEVLARQKGYVKIDGKHFDRLLLARFFKEQEEL
jgi:RimJ/RimL family protein N-acetyltransferase